MTRTKFGALVVALFVVALVAAVWLTVLGIEVRL